MEVSAYAPRDVAGYIAVERFNTYFRDFHVSQDTRRQPW